MIKRIKNLSQGSILLLAVGYTIGVTLLFIIPVKGTQTTTLPIDKVIHVCIHALLVMAWASYALKKNGGLNKQHWMLLFLLCIAYGMLIEIVQEHFTSTRGADFWDVLANTLGTTIGVFIMFKRKLFFPFKDE